VEQSAQLIAQARQLDSRLRNATQTDRQLTRRAAGHLTQLARRLSVLLSRTPTALPMIPVAGIGRRLAHYVLHAERTEVGEAGATLVRMLTIGSNGMLRTGSTDLHGSSFVWIEYDPFDPEETWPVDTVLQWLADALQQLESQVEAVESRTRERTESLNALVSTTKRAASAPEGRAKHPFAALPPERGESRRATPAIAPALSPLYETGAVDAMEEMALADEDGEDVSGQDLLSDAEGVGDEGDNAGEDAASRHRRELFKRIR
jgi:hypothetical protein